MDKINLGNGTRGSGDTGYDGGVKINDNFVSIVQSINGYTIWDGETSSIIDLSNLSTTVKTDLVSAINEIIDQKGVTNGLASLDGSGLVPSSQLPSYVDEVQEYPTFNDFPATGETGIIYIALDTNYTYRWSGSAYIQLTDQTAIWGQINGDISNQTDVQPYIDLSGLITDDKSNLVAAINSILLSKGVASGIASLDGSGLVPASQLPSYVDSVREYSDFASFPTTGETGVIYIALDTNYTYRWNGSAYIQLIDQTAIWGQVGGDISNQTDIQPYIVSIVDKSFVDTLGVDADTLDGLDSSAFYLASNPDGYVDNTSDENIGGLKTFTSLLTANGGINASGQNITAGNFIGDGSNLTNLTTPQITDFNTAWDNRLATKTTSDLTEGINLYYTQSRFDSAFSLKSTSDLSEGINLYYTDTRVNNAIDIRVDKAFVDALGVDADTLDGLDSSAFYLASNPNSYIDATNVVFDNNTQTITGAKTFNALLTANGGINASGQTVTASNLTLTDLFRLDYSGGAWAAEIQATNILRLADSSNSSKYEFYGDIGELRLLNSSKIVGYNQDLTLDTNSSSYGIIVNKLLTANAGIVGQNFAGNSINLSNNTAGLQDLITFDGDRDWVFRLNNQGAGTQLILRDTAGSKDFIIKGNNGGFARFNEGLLYTSGQIESNGLLIANGGINSGGSIDATGHNVSANHFVLPDYGQLRLGSGNDMQVWHSGNNGYIDVGTGDFYIRDNIQNRFSFRMASGQLEAANYVGNWQGKAKPTNWGNNAYGGSSYESGLDLNTVLTVGESRFFQSNATNKPNGLGDGFVWTVAGGDTTNRGVQLAYENSDHGEFYFRSLNGKSWYQVASTSWSNSTFLTKSNAVTGYVRKNALEAKSFYGITNGAALIFTYAGSNNVDYISYNEGTNSFYFNADTTVGNTSGNAGIVAGSFALSALNTPPSSASATGTTGQIKWANGYVYLCVATNTWQRAALSTW